MAAHRQQGARDLASNAELGSDALQKLRRGELTYDEYLDGRVEQAIAHLRDTISAEQLDTVRTVLREQLEDDPILQELLRQVTAAEPPTA